MGYTALYREWRPRTFNDVVGQEHITTTLKNEILNDRIAHAYLFCGTRGTGKTSTAKVMAKALNCFNIQDGEPCNECEMCKKINEGLSMDVTELDAASNNGIDRIRDIIDDTKYPPQEGKYKIYILDEVHMLSGGAVNAFLKTLEEPPSNVIFILATTDPQKLPINILSRCKRFDFKRINQKDISDRLRKITESQNVSVDEKSLDLIARVADGAMRDSLSILDQAIAMGDNNIKYDDLISILGLVTNEYLFDITNSIVERNIEKAMVIIDKLVFSGKDIHLFIKDLIGHFRNLLMVKVSNTPEEILDMSLENIELIQSGTNVTAKIAKEQGKKIRIEEIMRGIRILQEGEANSKVSKQSRLYLELSIIKMCKIEYDTSSEVMLARINKLEESLKSGKIQVVSNSQINEKAHLTDVVPNNQVKSKEKQVKKEQPNLSEEHNVNVESSLTIDNIKRAWSEILEAFKAKRAMVIYASIVTARPYKFENGVATLLYEASYAFNKNRLEKLEYKKIVNEVFSEVLKDKIIVRYEVENNKDGESSKEELLKQRLDGMPFEILDE